MKFRWRPGMRGTANDGTRWRAGQHENKIMGRFFVREDLSIQEIEKGSASEFICDDLSFDQGLRRGPDLDDPATVGALYQQLCPRGYARIAARIRAEFEE